MFELPDTRSLSTDSLALIRILAVRAVVELGRSQRDTAQLFGVSENTVGLWCAAYRKDGIEGLKVQDQGRPIGAGRSLQPHQEQQAQHILRQDLPADHGIAASTWTRRAVAELFLNLFAVELTPEAVGKYLARWGMTPQKRKYSPKVWKNLKNLRENALSPRVRRMFTQKPARHAREQDPDEVQEFVEETLPEVLDRAEDEDAQLHFSDETGARAADQIGTSFAPQGDTPVIDIPKTRIEQNVISSVTPEGELFFWAFSGNLNADKFLGFLQHLVSETSQKLFVFTDRHPAHEAKAVEQWLDEHRSEIEIVWLPRYSPEHNPDEFLNDDLKQNLETEPLPDDTPTFRQTICDILDVIKSMPERIKGYFRHAKINLGLES